METCRLLITGWLLKWIPPPNSKFYLMIAKNLQDKMASRHLVCVCACLDVYLLHPMLPGEHVLFGGAYLDLAQWLWPLGIWPQQPLCSQRLPDSLSFVSWLVAPSSHRCHLLSALSPSLERFRLIKMPTNLHWFVSPLRSPHPGGKK